MNKTIYSLIFFEVWMTLLQKDHLDTEGTEFFNFSLLFSLCAYYPVGCGRTGFCSDLISETIFN